MARRQRSRSAFALAAIGVCLTAACGPGGGSTARGASAPGAALSRARAAAPATPDGAGAPSSGAPSDGTASSPSDAAGAPSDGGSGPAVTSSAAADLPPGGSLRGRVVVIDPGHNGANYRHTMQIARSVDVANGTKACDTTGTQTNAGYTEAAFTLDVSLRLAALLRAQGARVVLTRTTNLGVGPCITERAAIGNRARADAAISIHADGAAARSYGFHVIVPLGIGPNDAIVAPSRRLGAGVRDAFRTGTGEALSTYTGTTTGGLVSRGDLGGLNLSTVPKVFIECGNMRNAADARRMTSATWRQRAADALAAGITHYLTAP